MSFLQTKTIAWVSTLALVAALLVLPLAPQASASEAAPPAFGSQFHATWSDYSETERVAVLDKLAAAGIKWVRIDVGWTSLQETGPLEWNAYHLGKLDRIVDQAQARGIQVLATLWLTPSWANGGAGSRKPPTNPADYAAAARYLADHFKGRIAAWEVWNEPNLNDFFDGSLAGYVNLLKVAYPAFKLGDPGAQVVLGGPSYNDTGWLRSAYEAGAQGSFDVMATHPYQGIADAPPEKADDGSRYTMAHVSKVYELMQQFGDGGKKIWFTEFGWSDHANWDGISNWERGVSAAQQADFAVRTLEYLKANHPYVTNVFWYNERNRSTGNKQLDNYGLLNRDLTAKPVYTALKQYLTSAPTGETTTEPPVVLEPPVVSEPPVVGEEPPAVEEPPVALPVELLSNGGFEKGVAPWTATKATVTRASDSYAGAYALKLSGRQYLKSLSSESVLAPQGLSFATGRVKAKAGQAIRLCIVEIANGVVVGHAMATVTTTGAWQQLPTVTYDATNSNSSLQLRVKQTSGRADVLVDALSLQGN